MSVNYVSGKMDGDAPMDRALAQIDPVPRVSIQAFCESPDIAAVVERCDIGSPNGESACQAEHGRRAGRG